jgi:hypothetical protein
MKPVQIKRLQGRSQGLSVHIKAHNAYRVESSDPEKPWYNVSVHAKGDQIKVNCTCDWTKNGGFGCAHSMAVLTHIAKRQGRAISFWATQEEAAQQKRRMLTLVGPEDEVIYITSRRAANRG